MWFMKGGQFWTVSGRGQTSSHTVIPLCHRSAIYYSGILSGISSDILSGICIWHIYLAYLLTFLLAFYLASLLTFFLAWYRAYLLTFLLAFYLAYLLTSFLAYVSGISSDSLSVILSGISSENLCGWGPAGTTLTQSLRWRSGGESSCPVLAVLVRRGRLRSSACSGGPAGMTLILGPRREHCDLALAFEVRPRRRRRRRRRDS